MLAVHFMEVLFQNNAIINRILMISSNAKSIVLYTKVHSYSTKTHIEL